MELFNKLKNNRALQILLLILLFGAIIRIAGLGAPSIRGDEGGSIFMASRSIPALFDNIHADSHPPLFYLLLHFWMKLGSSEFYLRLLPAIISILSIPLIFLVGKKLANERVGLFAAAILAFSQFHLRYAQTIRSYTLSAFLVLVSTYYLVSYLQDNRRRNLICYVVSSALCLYTHYYTAFILIAQNLFFFIKWKDHRALIKNWIIAQFGILLLFLPWLPVLFVQFTQPVPGSLTFYKATFYLFKLSVDNIFLRLGMVMFHISIGYMKFSLGHPLFLAVFLSSIIVFPLLLFRSLKGGSEGKNFLPLLLFAVPVAVLSVLWYTGLTAQLIYARYLLYCTPFYYLLIAKGLDSLPQARAINWSALLLSVILVLSSISIYSYYEYDSKQDDIRGVANFIKSNAGPGDKVVISTTNLVYHFKYYLGKDYPLILFPSNMDASNMDKLSTRNVYSAEQTVTKENSCKILDVSDNKPVWFVCSLFTDESAEACSLVKNCMESGGYRENAEKTYKSEWADIYGEKTADFQVLNFVKSD